MLEPVIIGQDDQSELHVQPIVQSGRRQLDIRIWRRGPTGFAPSRSALTLEATDVVALREGIAELLEASAGGRNAARVVWDKDEGRRLRAETEPFGTRFVARLGFWQRVRDTWRPADDGLVLTADGLQPLQEIIDRLLPRLQEPQLELPADRDLGLHPHVLLRWPMPGADWLTSDPDRIAFHPRGIRITAQIEEGDDGRHRLVLRQWHRQESLWLPEEGELSLDVPDLDALLTHLQVLADTADAEVDSICRPDGSLLRVGIQPAEKDGVVHLDVTPPPPDDYLFARRISIPVEYLPRFGRLLAQAGMMLIMHLTAAERDELQRHAGPEIAPAIVEDALPLEEEAVAEPEEPETEASDVPPVPAREPELPKPARHLTPLGERQLGRQVVFLYLLKEDGRRYLSLQWSGRVLLVPIADIAAVLSGVRQLYYDALRGRRGRAIRTGSEYALHMSVHNQGAAIAVVLEQDVEGRTIHLTLAVGEVPTFLDTIEAVGKKIASHGA